MAETLECVICSDVYRDPVMLPCGHSYCLTCLQGWVDREWGDGDANPSADPPPGGRSLTCPECRKRHDLPGGEVQNLPRNIALIRALPSMNNSSVQQVTKETLVELRDEIEELLEHLHCKCEVICDRQEDNAKMKARKMKNAHQASQCLGREEGKVISQIKQYFQGLQQRIEEDCAMFNRESETFDCVAAERFSKLTDIMDHSRKKLENLNKRRYTPQEIFNQYQDMIAVLKEEAYCSPEIEAPEACDFIVEGAGKGADLGNICGRLGKRKITPEILIAEEKGLNLDIKLRLMKKFSARVEGDDQDPYVNDAAVMGGRHVAVVDTNNKKVKVFTVHGRLECEFKLGLGGSSQFICPDEAHNQGLFCDGQHLVRWNIISKTLSIVTTLPNSHGVTLSRHLSRPVIAVGDYGQKQIKMFDLNTDEEFGRFEIDGDCWWIAGHPDNESLVVSDLYWITCYKGGRKTWRSEPDIITNPQGLAVTADGSVIAADAASNKVLLLSPDGILVDTLLSEEDEICGPVAVACEEMQRLLLVTDRSEQSIHVYEF